MTTVFALCPTPPSPHPPAAPRGGAHERVFRRRTHVHPEATIRLAAERWLTRDEAPHRPALRGHFKLHRRTARRAPGGARQGGGSGGSVGRFAYPSSFLTLLRSMINASSRSRPPHFGHANTSSPNPRPINSAHCRRRCRGSCSACVCSRSGCALAVGAAVGRPYSTTRARHAARDRAKQTHILERLLASASMSAFGSSHSLPGHRHAVHAQDRLRLVAAHVGVLE